MLRLLIVLGVWLWFTPALAAEQRCTELGVNCVCSEPLNTSNLVQVGYWYNPADSTSKECVEEYGQAAGSAVFYNQPTHNDIFMSNDPIVLSRLPNRQSVVQYFIRSIEGQIGEFSVGNNQFFPQPNVFPFTRTQLASVLPGNLGGNYIAVARWAQRFYYYLSDNFEFEFTGTCGNGKRTLTDQLNTVHLGSGTLGTYNFGWDLDCSLVGLGPNCGHFKIDGPNGSQYEPDCCNNGGPATSSGSLSPPGGQGKWWRIENVITNRLGPGFRYQVFLKNVTDNGPELMIQDTNGTYGNGSAGPWVPSAQLTPNEVTPILNFYLGGKAYGYRGGTPCLGWQGYTHYMQAQWDTNAGQRIGPAYEVEGGTASSDTTPPAAPTSLRVF
jgi:hypothetical protein